MIIHVAKTQALISFPVTAKLICVFVFTYADCWFSHVVAHQIMYILYINLVLHVHRVFCHANEQVF